jgi:hypothetical protein
MNSLVNMANALWDGRRNGHEVADVNKDITPAPEVTNWVNASGQRASSRRDNATEANRSRRGKARRVSADAFADVTNTAAPETGDE